MSMRRCYIYFLLTYFHNSSKKEHITKYSIKSTINSTEAKIKLSFQRADGTFSTWSLALSFLTRDAPQYLAHNVPLSFMSFLNFASAAATVMLFQVICFTWCSNLPAATPTGHFLSGPSSDPSARHVLVRPSILYAEMSRHYVFYTYYELYHEDFTCSYKRVSTIESWLYCEESQLLMSSPRCNWVHTKPYRSTTTTMASCIVSHDPRQFGTHTSTLVWWPELSWTFQHQYQGVQKTSDL